jgi:hypothetical protein
VQDENDAAQVQEALTPLLSLVEDGRALLAVHHLGKRDGEEGTGARGSTALAAAVDVLLELRRLDPKEPNNPRRVLKGYGRFDAVPHELVIELGPNGYVPVTGSAKDQQKVTKEQERAAKQVEKDKADEFALLKALDDVDADRGGYGVTALRKKLGFSGMRVNGAIARLAEVGMVGECTVKVRRGKAGEKDAEGVRRLANTTPAYGLIMALRPFDALFEPKKYVWDGKLKREVLVPWEQWQARQRETVPTDDTAA